MNEMKQIRTDLASEIYDHVLEHNPAATGITLKKEERGPLLLERVTVENEAGEALTGKKKGDYVTIHTGKLWLDDREVFREKLLHFAALLSNFLPETEKEGSVLVAGLGNESVTADAIGPIAAKHLIVTRHLRSVRPLIFEDLGLFDVCAVTPGVLGQTGIESADAVKSIVGHIRPTLLLAVDALASLSPERLVTTVQIGNTGIHPGSGIGNTRPGLTKEEIGIPVISIGVPTVVDAATLAADAIFRFSGQRADEEAIRGEWAKSKLNFFVTPKETDQIIRVMGSFIGYGINLALNRDLSYEDMLSLVG